MTSTEYRYTFREIVTLFWQFLECVPADNNYNYDSFKRKV